MYIVLWVAILLAIASVPWFIWPMSRVLQTDGVGFMRERLMFGFWFPISNLSNRKNTLEVKKHKLEKQLSLTIKQLKDEEKFLSDKVKIIDREYKAHLVDMGGKHSWQYLWRKCHMPTAAVVKEVEKEKESKDGRKVTYFTLEGANLPPDFILDKDKGRLVKKYQYLDNSRNQQQSNNQRKKGNSNQQQSNQQ